MPFRTITLVALAGLGLVSSGRLAFFQWSTGEACPVLGSVPACYIAFLGYVLVSLGLGLVLSGHAGRGRGPFYAGLGVVGGLALFGSALELLQGGVCPRAAGVPLCFVSLGMSVALLLLFRSSVKASVGRPGRDVQ